jgi:hypothetical protein
MGARYSDPFVIIVFHGAWLHVRNVCGDLGHANVRRTAAIGSADRGNIDSDDSEVAELHCRHLFDRDRHLGLSADVIGIIR